MYAKKLKTCWMLSVVGVEESRSWQPLEIEPNMTPNMPLSPAEARCLDERN